jgi:hypothetical protein
MTEPSTALDDMKVHVKVKISALWACIARIPLRLRGQIRTLAIGPCVNE